MPQIKDMEFQKAWETKRRKENTGIIGGDPDITNYGYCTYIRVCITTKTGDQPMKRKESLHKFSATLKLGRKKFNRI